jgi:hypothetical protein
MKNQKELKRCFRIILVNMLCMELDIICNSNNEKILGKTINLLLKDIKSLLT